MVRILKTPLTWIVVILIVASVIGFRSCATKPAPVATQTPQPTASIPPADTETPLPADTEVPTSVVKILSTVELSTDEPATATPAPATSVADNGSMPQFVKDISHGAWKISGTDRLKDNVVVSGWLSRLKDPAPSLWKTFPNVPNKDVPEFRVVKCAEDPSKECVPDGMEYGTYSTPYCWQSPCDIPVGAWEYRYITGDYHFLDLECKGDKSKGCMLVLINVMDQSYTWRQQYVDNGFTLRGRYFNGDALEWGVWGLVSHGSANMLNMKTYAHPGEVLNSGDPGNSGANCGVPNGCKSVDVTVIVHAGDAIIAVAHTVVTK